MMANQILIMAHSRPSCLWLCLESLRQCRGIEKYPICVAWAEDSHPEIPSVVEKLCQGLDYEAFVHPAGWLGLRSQSVKLKYAFAKSDDFIIVLEEDQEVSKDFLELLEYAASHFCDERLLTIVGRGEAIPRAYTVADNELLWVKKVFAFRGYLLFKESFQRYLEPYLCDDLYRSESRDSLGIHSYDGLYLDNLFPGVKVGAYGLDGVFQRVMQQAKLYALHSVVPRCHVTGFFGMHTQGISDEALALFRSRSLEERVAFLKGAIQSQAIKDFFGGWASEYWPIEDDHKWGELRVRSEGMY